MLLEGCGCEQGLLWLIETQLSSVGSSLVQWLALEFSSCWKWGSCGSRSLRDERFSHPAHPAHPAGAPLGRGAHPEGRACVRIPAACLWEMWSSSGAASLQGAVLSGW